MASGSSSSSSSAPYPRPETAVVCNLLTAVQAANGEVRKAAEQQLQEFLAESPDQTLHGLATVLPLGDVPVELRQGAAVILRRCIVGKETDAEADMGDGGSQFWLRLHADTKAFVRLQLLAALEAVPTSSYALVARSAAAAVVALVEEEFDEFNEVLQEWPQLLVALSRMVSKSSEWPVRVIGLTVLKDLADSLGEDLLQHEQAGTLTLLQDAISDDQPEVSASGVQLLLQLLVEVSSSTVQLLQPLLAAVPVVLQALLGFPALESLLKETMEALIAAIDERAEVFKGPHLEKLWIALMRLCRGEVQHVFGTADVQHSAMEAAMSLLLTMPKEFCLPEGQPLLKQFINMNLEWMLELEEDVAKWTAQADTLESDELDSERLEMAEENFDRLGAEFRKSGRLEDVLLPLIFKELRMLSEGSPQTWPQTRGAIVVVSEIVEYVEEESWIDHCVTFAGQHVCHPHPRVRHAAFQAIGQAAQDHEPYVQEMHHDFLLTAVATGLEDSNIRVVASAASAFTSLAEGCSFQDAAPHLEGIVTRLIARLTEARTREVQEQSLSAVAAAAQLAEDHFLPHYPQTMPVVFRIINACTSEEEQVLRGKAFECASLICDAVGKEACSGAAMELMQIMFEKFAMGFAPDDASREYIQDSIGRLALTLGQDFRMYVPPLLQCLTVLVQQLHSQQDGLSRGKNLQTAVRSELKDAIALLRQVMEALQEDSAAFLPDACKMLLPLAECSADPQLLEVTMQAFEELTKCARQALDRGKMKHEVLRSFAQTILSATLAAMTSTDDALDAQALAALQARGTGVSGVVRNAGKGILSADEVLQLSQSVLSLLSSLGMTLEDKAPARRRRKQKTVEDDSDLDELKDDEEGPSRETVRFCLADILGSSMCSNPEDVASLVLPRLATVLQHLLRQSAASPEKGLALYIADDIVERLGDLSVPFWGSFMESTVRSILDRSSMVRQYAASTASNAAKFPGFAQIAPLAASNIASVLLKQGEKHKKRRAVSTEAKQRALALDACIAALGALCEHQEAALGSNAPQAWKLWLSNLPLRYDEEEGQKTHARLLELVGRMHPVVTCDEALPQVVGIMADIYKTHFSNPVIDGEIVSSCSRAGADAISRLSQQLPKRLVKKVSLIMLARHSG